jgi:Ca2+-binding RTX toxin-like protein
MANINGTNSKDILFGTNIADTINGGDGNDLIFAGGGNDILIGGKGGDVIDGGDGIDLASYADSSSGVWINLATNSNHGGTAEGDTLLNIENIWGSKFDDFLTGDAGNNSLTGGFGNDTFHTGGGTDHIFGGDGSDTAFVDNGFANFDGGSGIDTIDFSGRSWGVYVDLTAGKTYAGPFPKPGTSLNITDVENVVGTKFADTIIGSGESNRITGGAGDDKISGKGGDDTFVFSGQRHAGGPITIDIGHDVINDFTHGLDQIEFHTWWANFGVVQAHMSQVGADTVITIDANNSITLHDVQMGSLTANDFLFVP